MDEKNSRKSEPVSPVSQNFVFFEQNSGFLLSGVMFYETGV